MEIQHNLTLAALDSCKGEAFALKGRINSLLFIFLTESCHTLALIISFLNDFAVTSLVFGLGSLLVGLLLCVTNPMVWAQVTSWFGGPPPTFYVTNNTTNMTNNTTVSSIFLVNSYFD
jgi:hypothetical protein